MKKYILFHGGCPDGFGAAWCFWKKFGNDAEYIPCFHGKQIPDLINDSEVYIIDFSFKCEVLLDLETKHKKIVLLDHHISAQKELENLSFATFDMDKSGAILAWEYLNPGVESPKLLKYVEDRDLWLFKLPHSKEINAYISIIPFDFNSWDKMVNDLEQGFDSIKQNGSILLKYDQQNVSQICKQTKMVEFENQMVPSVNTPILNSDVGNKLLQLYPEAKFSITWYMNRDNEFKVSLRSKGDFDVSEVAKKYGGGGHKSAAGCRVDNIP